MTFIDWLGNEINKGDIVLYSSSSTLTGMNLGIFVGLTEKGSAQVRVSNLAASTQLPRYWPQDGKLVTLPSHTGAFQSITKYFFPKEGTNE